jgi:hypothetical protein
LVAGAGFSPPGRGVPSTGGCACGGLALDVGGVVVFADGAPFAPEMVGTSGLLASSVSPWHPAMSTATATAPHASATRLSLFRSMVNRLQT